MTLPEQSDRAVAQTREFLVRLCSPYGEGAIKKIRREVRAEALALLRHYPRSYAGATVHKNCTLTTARLGCDTSVWMPAGEQLSQKCDCPAPDNAAIEDNVGRELAQDATNTLTYAERAAVERAIRTLDEFQKRGGWHSAVDDDAATLWGLLGRLT